MPGKTIGIKMHGPTETVLDARFKIVKEDGRFSVAAELITGTDQVLVAELKTFLEQITKRNTA